MRHNAVDTQMLDQDYWVSAIKPEVVGIFAVKPEGLPTLQLYRYLKHLRDNHQDTGRYELALWNKFFLPVATIVMVLIAIPFVFLPLRSGRMGSRLFVGVILGLGFTLLQRGFGFFGLVYGLPPLMGAVFPIALFLAAVIYLFHRVQ